jgi:SAM-dependent methyltransferase
MNTPVLVRVPCPLCGGHRTRHERVVHGFALERCAGCDFVFVSPQYPPEAILDDYRERGNPDGLAAHYAHVTTPAVLAGYDRVLTELEAALPGRGRLLDFGCGPGYFVERAARRGWRAEGVEVGEWAQRAASERGVTTVHVGRLAAQRFPDGCFDVVTANQVLEHLPAPREELAEIRRVLRPGGLLYVEVPNYRRISILVGRDRFELNYPMAHVNYFTPATLRRLAEACGFDVLRTSTHGGLNWENLLGRPIASAENDAHRGVAAASAGGAPPAARLPLWKRALLPLVRTALYRWAQVGMTLEVFGRRRG